MDQGFSRRSFLIGSGTGTAVLTLPGFLAGCAASGVRGTRDSLPDDPFGEWFGIDERVAGRVLAELESTGVTHTDLYFQHSRSNSVRLEDGIVSQASSSIDQGVGLRVVVGDQVGYAFTEDLTEEAMKAAARTASAIAGGSVAAEPRPVSYRPETSGYYRVRVPWSTVGIDRKLPILRRTEELAKAGDPAVKKVAVYWGDVEERVLMVARDGRAVLDSRPMARLSVSVTAEKDGVTLSNGATVAGRNGFEHFTEAELAEVAQQAVDRTMILFEARRPPAGELPVILAAGASGILLHEAIGHGLEADFNRKGTSIYSTMIGDRIAPDFVTIVDDGTIENARGSLNTDDEGNETENTVLVEDGILRSYLHDRISAAHYKVESTGSGRRESFRHVPLPRMRCTHMLNGPHGRDEVISSIKGTGIIAETFTNGQVQIGAGDFSFYIKNGWLIEDGKVTAPIKDTNIIGNGPEVLRNVTMAADDARMDGSGWTCGKSGQSVPVSLGLPSILVSSMNVGGQNA